MKTIGLVSCVSRKGDYPAPGEELYRSPLFDGLSNYARTRTDNWHILSAKYGLLEPRRIVRPYNTTLVGTPRDVRVRWAKQVFARLRRQLTKGDRAIFLAGAPYREFLEPLLDRAGIECAAPLSTLGIGRQVAWLRRLSSEGARVQHLDRLYGLVERLRVGLNGDRTLADCQSKTGWPTKGLYLFFESGERRMLNPFEDRIVRVGTHAVSAGSVSSLWGRIRTHRGGTEGSGNHRGSIFRLHVGNSILNRSLMRIGFPTWGKGQSAPKDVRESEVPLEQEVSSYLGKTRVLFVNVPDDAGASSDRAYLERNIIALLAGPSGPIDLPSSSWLGRDSTHEAIRASGLWNVNHTSEVYDPAFLDVFERYVDATAGTASLPTRSLAPTGWNGAIRSVTMQLRQRSLF